MRLGSRTSPPHTEQDHKPIRSPLVRRRAIVFARQWPHHASGRPLAESGSIGAIISHNSLSRAAKVPDRFLRNA